MAANIEVLFTPADFGTLRQRDLTKTVCVVFDVLRATSTIVTALANGAAAFIPVEEIPEALALWNRTKGGCAESGASYSTGRAVRGEPTDALLAGERDGLRIGAEIGRASCRERV